MAVSESPISIYALGGLCEVGKNTYCIESENSLIIINQTLEKWGVKSSRFWAQYKRKFQV